MCEFSDPKFLIFSENVTPLVYYSHLPIIFIALALGIFIYRKGKENLANRILFWIAVAFSFWIMLDSIFWASNRSDIIMFVWATILLVEPLVYIGGFYLVYVLLEKKDMPFILKVVGSVLLLPIILTLPTEYSLSGFDITSCLSVEGPIALYYVYAVEIFVTVSLIIFSLNKYSKIKDKKLKNEAFFVIIGVILLLASFASGNIIGSYTGNWDAAQVGLFGMPIFIGFLAYTITKFKTFNVKVIGTNVLVVALVLMIASTLVVNDLQQIRTILEVTLLLSGIFGILLIRGVRKEVHQREEIEKLAIDLQKANERLKELDKQKTEFVSFATHQLRSPLTAMKGYASLILEGDYGELNNDLRMAIERIQDSSNTLTTVVDDYLNISRIELGTMKYSHKKVDFNELVSDILGELMPTIEKTGLSFSYTADKKQSYPIYADRDKFKQVILNLVDNALKYTQKGSIALTLEKKPNRTMLLTIKDTGIGIPEKLLPKLFEKFIRAENAHEVNIRGTGLGLYVAKEIIKAHGGKIWAESEGEGKGSQFYIEMPEDL